MHRLSAAVQHGHVNGLRQALRWLDGRLARALDADPAEPPDPLRGLYVIARRARDLVSGQLAGRPAPDDPRAAEGSLAVLAGRFGLSGPDLELLVVVLAPELDLRYEQIYRYLQDDVTRRRATVELVLRLVFNDFSHQSPGHAHPWPTAPPVRHGLVEIAREPGQSALVVDEEAKPAQARERCPHLDALAAHVTEFAKILTGTATAPTTRSPPSRPTTSPTCTPLPAA